MDKYAELRAALEIGPTTGPWDIETDIYGKVISIGPINTETSLGWAYIDAEEKDIKAVSACNPDTIRALLAERDALREALQSIVDCCDEDHAARDYSSRQTEIRGIARYALAQEQGEKHDNKD